MTSSKSLPDGFPDVVAQALRDDAATQSLPDEVLARIDAALAVEQQLRLERAVPLEEPNSEVDSYHWGSFGANRPSHYTKRGLGMRNEEPTATPN